MLTLTDHKQAVWAARWHDLGEVLASASLDHSVRLWDVAAGKCRHALRGHVDSVNDCCWQPFSNVLCTGGCCTWLLTRPPRRARQSLLLQGVRCWGMWKRIAMIDEHTSCYRIQHASVPMARLHRVHARMAAVGPALLCLVRSSSATARIHLQHGANSPHCC